jgi:hypothetical protein
VASLLSRDEESDMRTIIAMVLVGIGGAQFNIAMARSQAESRPAHELINYPECGYPQSSAFWLVCDAFED